MGIFNERNISVFSQTMPLAVEDPPTVQDAVLYSVLKNEPIGKTVIDFQMSGSTARINSARAYAKNSYTLGLPSSATTTSGQVNSSVVADVITDNLSLPYGCLVTYNIIKSLWLFDIARPFLEQTRGFVDRYSTITIIPSGWEEPMATWDGHKVLVFRTYLEDVSINPADGTEMLLTYRRTLKYRGKDRLYLVPTEEYDEFYVESYSIPSGLQPGKLYCIANYRVIDSAGTAAATINRWYYLIETGDYPTLMPPVVADLNSHYPVVPIRYERTFINSIDNPDLYRTGKFLLRKLGISFDDTTSTLATNPDIDEIDHAYIMLGIDLQRNDDIANRYLLEFFHYLSTVNNSTVYDALEDAEGDRNIYEPKWGMTASVNDSPLHTYNYSLDGGVTQVTVVNPADALKITEHGLDIQLYYGYITSTIEVGSIGPIGTITREYTYRDRTVSENAYNLTGVIRNDASDVHIKQQLTTNTYRYVKVIDLIHHNKIYGHHGVITRPKDVDDDPNNHNLVIPLHHAVLQNIPTKDRNSLYDAAMFMVINGYTDEHVAWYESSVFRMVINVVAMVAATLTLQTWLGVGIIIATMGVNAVLLYILTLTVMVGAFQVGVDALSKKLGPDVATAIALTALAMGIAKVTGYVPIGISAIPAESFMYVGSSFIRGSEVAMNELLADVDTEYSEFMIDAAAKMEILKAKEELLESTYTLPFSYLEDPLYYKPDIKTKPERFYDKIHVGNIGTLSLDMVESYVERALMLPEGINQE